MSLSERDLFIWHKRPIYMAKEAYGNEHDRAYPKEAYRGLPKEAYGGLKEAYIFCLLQKRPMEMSKTDVMAYPKSPASKPPPPAPAQSDGS